MDGSQGAQGNGWFAGGAVVQQQHGGGGGTSTEEEGLFPAEDEVPTEEWEGPSFNSSVGTSFSYYSGQYEDPRTPGYYARAGALVPLVVPGAAGAKGGFMANFGAVPGAGKWGSFKGLSFGSGAVGGTTTKGGLKMQQVERIRTLHEYQNLGKGPEVDPCKEYDAIPSVLAAPGAIQPPALTLSQAKLAGRHVLGKYRSIGGKNLPSPAVRNLPTILSKSAAAGAAPFDPAAMPVVEEYGLGVFTTFCGKFFSYVFSTGGAGPRGSS